MKNESHLKRAGVRNVKKRTSQQSQLLTRLTEERGKMVKFEKAEKMKHFSSTKKVARLIFILLL